MAAGGDETAAAVWDAARAALIGLPGGGLNMAVEAVERQVLEGRGGVTALRWHGKDGAGETFTYEELLGRVRDVAGALKHLGCGPGVRVFTLLGRVPELYATVLGTLYAGGVAAPLFPAFGPEPVKHFLALAAGEVLVTSRALYEHRVAPVRAEIPSLRDVLIVDAENHELPFDTRSWHGLVEEAKALTEPARTGPEDPALLHFTSGTTGTPKGAMHVHGAIAQHRLTGQSVLDLQAGDVFWCTADPGSITATAYGILAPLANGATLVVDESEFGAGRCYDRLEHDRVTVWYTAPTAIRMLMRAGAALIEGHDLSALRVLASGGEPLNREAVAWAERTFKRPFRDTWWQTETGAIVIANTPGMTVKPGSMGRALPGVEVALVRRRDGVIERFDAPDQVGELALKSPWPAMFSGYLGAEERYREAFADGWYLTGDFARRDGDGCYWFVGRADDVITSAGRLIGPCEVENVLLEHPAVAEAGVVGLPDEGMGEIVKAFVVLKAETTDGESMARQLLSHARRKLGATAAPSDIIFRRELPQTWSGKIMRRLLRARELGLPESDLSTLATDERS